MKCCVCAGNRFAATEYKTGNMSAPAMECVNCLAIVLEEGLARTKEERESVKIAIALRASVRDMPGGKVSAAIEPEKPRKPNAAGPLGKTA